MTLSCLLPDLRVHSDDFRLGVLHRQIVAFGLRSFTLGFGLRQLYSARIVSRLRQEVLIAVAAEDQLGLAAGANLQPLRDGEDGLIRLQIADLKRALSARPDGVFTRRELLAAGHEVERDVRLDGSAQACESGD